MSERTGGQADGRTGNSALVRGAEPVSLSLHTVRPSARPPVRLECNRCGFPVVSRAWGCKNPCPNCGTVYPLGDCSD